MKTDGSDQKEKGTALTHSPVHGLKELLNSDYVKRRFKEVMGEKSAAFIASILNASQKNTELAKCDPQSVLASAMVAATLDLPIDSNLGFSAIVPYNTKRVDEQGREYWVSVAQFQIMYKGFIQLALRSGQYKTINVSPIYEDEFESCDIITGDVLIHPVDGGFREQENEEKIIGYAAFFRLLNGYERTDFWSLKKIQAHGKKYSKSFKNANGLWTKDPHAMYAKTVLKNTLSKWGILSVTMQNAMTVDQAMIKKFDEPFNGDNVNYIDNKTDGNEPVVRPKAGNGDHAGEDTAQNPPEQSAAVQPETASAPPPKAAPSAAKGGQGEKRDGLFSDDEAAALEEQYERSRNIPHFDD